MDPGREIGSDARRDPLATIISIDRVRRARLEAAWDWALLVGAVLLVVGAGIGVSALVAR
ncbi:MAG TPA: hypothetical protein VHO06_17940 [Polyangia bacterium]|nr:hypothetical protein [Polyangia bacterium]